MVGGAASSEARLPSSSPALAQQKSPGLASTVDAEGLAEQKTATSPPESHVIVRDILPKVGKTPQLFEV